MKEIATIMEVPYVDTNTPGWFAYRTKAAKNILDRMSEEDKKKIRQEAQEMSEKGFPEDLQRR
jgi:hypothetical protein